MGNEEFFTFGEYMKKEDGSLTASLQDYLEMIYRLSKNAGYTRINDLAAALNVQPSSVTKAVQKLFDLKLVNYEKYGIITLNRKGKEIGKQLLKRHTIIESFLRLINVEENKLLEETEKIEHTISSNTVLQLEMFVDFLIKRNDVLDDFKSFEQLKRDRAANNKY